MKFETSHDFTQFPEVIQHETTKICFFPRIWKQRFGISFLCYFSFIPIFGSESQPEIDDWCLPCERYVDSHGRYDFINVGNWMKILWPIWDEVCFADHKMIELKVPDIKEFEDQNVSSRHWKKIETMFSSKQSVNSKIGFTLFLDEKNHPHLIIQRPLVTSRNYVKRWFAPERKYQRQKYKMNHGQLVNDFTLMDQNSSNKRSYSANVCPVSQINY